MLCHWTSISRYLLYKQIVSQITGQSSSLFESKYIQSYFKTAFTHSSLLVSLGYSSRRCFCSAQCFDTGRSLRLLLNSSKLL